MGGKEVISWFDWLTLAAVFMGPLIGIYLTRFVDGWKEREQHRWALFTTLLRTRGLEASGEHVGAINMVPVLFTKDAQVMEEWRGLMDNLGHPAWAAEDAKVSQPHFEDFRRRHQALLGSIAKAVKARLPDDDRHRWGYSPIKWHHEEQAQQQLRDAITAVLTGERPLRVRVAEEPQKLEAPLKTFPIPMAD